MTTAREAISAILYRAGREMTIVELAQATGRNAGGIKSATPHLLRDGLVVSRRGRKNVHHYRWIGGEPPPVEASPTPHRHTAKADISSGGTISTTADTEAEARRMVADIAASIEAQFAKRRATARPARISAEERLL